ncbi:hypothetical protein NHX12_033763, partial [Muraenolepis orangiensis]
ALEEDSLLMASPRHVWHAVAGQPPITFRSIVAPVLCDPTTPKPEGHAIGEAPRFRFLPGLPGCPAPASSPLPQLDVVLGGEWSGCPPASPSSSSAGQGRDGALDCPPQNVTGQPRCRFRESGIAS